MTLSSHLEMLYDPLQKRPNLWIWTELTKWDWSCYDSLVRFPNSPSISNANKSGNFERYNIARNHLRFYNNVGTTATYEMPYRLVCENGVEGLTFYVLRRIIEIHPAMSVSIIDEASLNPLWVRLKEINLKEVVRFYNIQDQDGEDASRAIVEGAHQVPFERLGELPLWRLSVIRRHTGSEIQEIAHDKITLEVGFFWHHGIADGGSGIAFHMEFLNALNKLIIENCTLPTSIDSIVIVPKLDLLPSIEEAHPLPLSLFFIAKQILKVILPTVPDKRLWTGPPIRSENNRTRLHTLFFPFPIVDALVRRCRENNVTLTALVIVIIARVLAKFYPDYKRFKGKTAMSFRRFTGTDKNLMVNYTTSFNHRFSSVPKLGYINCGGSFSWTTVRACKREINAATAAPNNHTIGLFKFLRDYFSWLRNTVGSKRHDSFEVSNVGVMDVDQSHGVKINRVLFSQSSNVVGPPYIFCMATAKGGDLAIGLTCQDGVVEMESAERVLADLESELLELAKCE